MPDSTALSNIQEKAKNYEKDPLLAVQIDALRRWLRSPLLYGQVLRVLVYRLRNRDAPYGSFELQVLLLLTIAMEQRP
jgi:hypothetical protein